MTNSAPLPNPYKPGAGHRPPYLAGREQELDEFKQLLGQAVVLKNVVLTGLRGVGKTVLLDDFKSMAQVEGWLWAGNYISEQVSISDANLALRLIADLAVVTTAIPAKVKSKARSIGFQPVQLTLEGRLTYDALLGVYTETPGFVSDKLKAVLELVWSSLKSQGRRLVFAYDEAQNLSDNASKDEHPLSVLLDVFQTLQRQDVPFMLVLTGLPTLYPKLVAARTYAERMFTVITLDKLNRVASRDAIHKPIEGYPIKLSDDAVETICNESQGYPYFLQFIAREAYDVFIQQWTQKKPPVVPLDPIIRKLDDDFFSGRWAALTDRQKELLWVVASLDHANDEFTIQEIVGKSKELIAKPFSPSYANRLLGDLTDQGMVYKNRWGKYLFAVPMMDRFILRTFTANTLLPA